MTEFSLLIYEIIIWFFLLYSAAVFLIYTWIGLYAMGAVFRYKYYNTFTDYSIIAANPNAPTFSLIAPAYNEGMTIVDNVRSLLSLYYHNLEIIIVNDGSKDDSMQKLIAAYELDAISYYVEPTIETKEIRGIYKSKNPAFKKLIVVDKENGGKADALNVGVNISSGDYIVCIDVDCILEQDAILRLAKPFLEQTNKKVIACGGVIRLANNCKIENGKVLDVNIPKTWLGRSQALEYIRAFVLGRMAWSRASGLILISGAFGAFDRKIVLECGGYDRNTVGEDMELVVRMRKYMEDKKIPYEVQNIPDPLCWTEVPETKEILRKQRNRWMRGTMETLWKHRDMMFNPKYGKLGMVSLPYWFFFEFLGPLIEFSGVAIFIIFLLLGIINWPFFLLLFALVISSGILYSIYAILVDLVSKQVYSKPKDFLTLILTAVLEPLFFHPIVVKAGVKGFVDYFKKSYSWGEMTRQGFNQTVENLPWKQRILEILKSGLKQFGVFSNVFLVLFSFGVLSEWAWYQYSFENVDKGLLALDLAVNNLKFALQFIFVFGVIYLIINSVKESWAKILTVVLGTLIIMLQCILFIYFSESHNLLGADILYYKPEEIKRILLMSGILSIKNIALMFILLAVSFIPFWMASKSRFKKIYYGLVPMILGIFTFFIPNNLFSGDKNATEFQQNAGNSKWSYFFNSNTDNLIEEHPDIFDFLNDSETTNLKKGYLSKNYPFWKKENTPDFLGKYFNKSSATPNLVLITVEGLGAAFSSPKGYIGNYTPFIDSLANKSLYWEFNLSSSGRTFAAIPTLTGSLPFGKNGFLEINETPHHFNLFNILKKNGFETGFFHGGNSSFDRMKEYLQYSEVNNIIDQYSFSKPYKKLPSHDGESWGYEDQAVFNKMLEVQKPKKQPYFDMILTLSTHQPFLINNEAYYEKVFEKRLMSAGFSSSQKKMALENKKQLVSVLNLDDAMKKFFEKYSKRPDFENTIFIITGDHSMPEITLQQKIDRYHVPLMIYSPLLKESKRFRSIVSHFDVAPSILAFYRENYQLKTPSSVTWLGDGLSGDLSKNTRGIPLMQSKNQLIDYVLGKYHIANHQLYAVASNLQEEPVQDASSAQEIKKRFLEFKRMNNKFYNSKKLMPDSVYNNFMKKNTPKP